MRAMAVHFLFVIYRRGQEIEDQLRSAILQIDKSSAHLPLRHGCTFALHVEADDHGMTQTETDQEYKVKNVLR